MVVLGAMCGSGILPLALLFHGQDWDKGLPDEELQQVLGRVMGWFDGISKSGKVKAGQPLARRGKIFKLFVDKGQAL